MRYLIAGLLLIAIGAVPVLGLDAPPSVSVTKLEIQKEVPAALDVHFFNEKGVHFAFTLSQPDQVIVGINKKASKLILATDDKGTNFAKDPRQGWILDVFSKISSTNHDIAIPITFAELPAPGATTIQFKAEIVLTCGSQEKTESIKPFELAKGTNAQIGEHMLKISVGERQNKNSLMLQVVSAENSNWLKKYEFVDEQGIVIKTENAGSESMGGVTTQFVALSTDVKTAGLRVTYFGKLEDIKQTIDMKIGLGLP